MVKRKWVYIAIGACLVATVVAFGVNRAIQEDDSQYLARTLAAEPFGQPFSLTTATRFSWDTLELYRANLHPITGETNRFTARVPQEIRDYIENNEVDWVFAFVSNGVPIKWIAVDTTTTPVPAFHIPRANGLPSQTLYVRTHCDGWTASALLPVDPTMPNQTRCPDQVVD